MPTKAKLTVNLNGLESLKKLAQANQYVAKVGVLGDKNQRSGQENLGNADIGAIHEFGSLSRNIPSRSFLRMPFAEKKKEFSKEIAEIVKKEVGKGQPDIVRIFNLIGASGYALVQKAFATGGFGKWKPLKPATIKAKGSDAILIDSGQLRKSITYKTDRKK